jgi:beta-lactamase regulating signal transducer with metallopeptidase domain
LHELAHLRRYDDWTNLAQKLVKALFFFHPAVWWIEKQVSLEREMACDDAVLAETASPRAYAECLAHLAEKTASSAKSGAAKSGPAQRSPGPSRPRTNSPDLAARRADPRCDTARLTGIPAGRARSLEARRLD